MSAPGARRVNLLLVSILLLISILLEQYWIARFFPWIGGLGGFRPMIVFLDIPLALPNIDWVPVSILFAVFYSIVISPELSRGGQRRLVRAKVWRALTGWWLLLICILAGGGVYYLIQDYLPKPVQNGIDSVGLRADITLPWPSGEVVHLHGSMLLLIFFGLGLYFMARRSAILTPAEAQALVEAASNTPAPAIARPAVAKSQATQLPPITAPVIAPPPPTRTPVPQGPPARPAIAQAPPVRTPAEAPTCRLTTPPPIAVIMPRPVPGIGKMHPCIVTGIQRFAEELQ
jgi:hypothetical protein